MDPQLQNSNTSSRIPAMTMKPGFLIINSPIEADLQIPA
jgi:hypothetical protein